MLRAMPQKDGKPYIIVVTDLVSTHTAWFTNDASCIIVPTEKAIRKAMQADGVNAEKLKVIGPTSG